ncbi:hypothetical protein VIBNISO65_260080 [Vibrio nigripulchritudo SO65]|nr:hypothetical protein VIBNISO65_260080 [Vibrio nigripulchritudo SO65]
MVKPFIEDIPYIAFSSQMMMRIIINIIEKSNNNIIIYSKYTLTYRITICNYTEYQSYIITYETHLQNDTPFYFGWNSVF